VLGAAQDQDPLITAARTHIRVVRFEEDFSAIYINGEIAWEGNGLSLEDFLAVLQSRGACKCIDARVVNCHPEDDEYATLMGTAPDFLTDYKHTKGLT
jgi:hypothetical protein